MSLFKKKARTKQTPTQSLFCFRGPYTVDEETFKFALRKKNPKIDALYIFKL